MPGQKKDNSKQIGVRLTYTLLQKIDVLIEKGYAKNYADFCQKAVVEHLIQLRMIEIEKKG